jgi:hypothetical protein
MHYCYLGDYCCCVAYFLTYGLYGIGNIVDFCTLQGTYVYVHFSILFIDKVNFANQEIQTKVAQKRGTSLFSL